MRIVQFCPHYPPHRGGLETYLFEWSAEWRKVHGNETLLNVVFATGKVATTQAENDSDIIVPAFEVVHNFPFPKFWKLGFWKAIRRIIGFKPTHLLTHTRFFAITLFGGIMSMFVSAKWVHTEHGSDFVVVDSNFVTRASKWYDLSIGRWCLRHADKIIAISHAASEFVYKLSGKTSIVNYPGVTLPPYLPKSSEPEARKSPIRMIFAGRLVQLKGCHIFLDALRTLSQNSKKEVSRTDVEVEIFGDGPELVRLQEMTKNIPLTINFRGFVSREVLVSEVYPHSDILVVPSLQEGLGLTAIEGLALGMVVIASDVGGLPEISDKDDLMLFLSGDAIALTDAITRAIQDLEHIRGMSTEGVREKFSWGRNIGEFARIMGK